MAVGVTIVVSIVEVLSLEPISVLAIVEAVLATLLSVVVTLVIALSTSGIVIIAVVASLLLSLLYIAVVAIAHSSTGRKRRLQQPRGTCIVCHNRSSRAVDIVG